MGLNQQEIDESMLIGLKYNNLVNWLYRKYPEIITEYEQEQGSTISIYT